MGPIKLEPSTWGHQNRGGAVRGADNANGGGVLNLKAQQSGQHDGHKNAKLSRRAEEEHLRVGEQGTKVDHGANADEQQQRERLGGLDAHLEQPLNNAVGLAGAFHHLVEHARAGQVHQDSAKTHGQQQRGFILFLDGQPDEHRAHHIHDRLLPGNG